MAAKKVVPLAAKKKPPELNPEPTTQEEERESISSLMFGLGRTLHRLDGLLYIADDFCGADHKDDTWTIALDTLIGLIKEVAEEAQEQGEDVRLEYMLRHKGDYR
jgi:hypothetical protein